MELPNIIQSDIINLDTNTFWNDNSPIIKDIMSKPLLVLTNSFHKGSIEDIQLEKMLQACKLMPEHYNILQLEEDQKIAWHKLRDALMPSKILLLGVHPQQLGISALFRINEINHFNDCIFIPSLSLSHLEKQPNVRSQLWNNALKPSFVE